MQNNRDLGPGGNVSPRAVLSVTGRDQPRDAMVARAFILLTLLAEASAKSCIPNKAGTPGPHYSPRQGASRPHLTMTELQDSLVGKV